MLGIIYYNGESISRDIDKSIYYFSLASDQNDSKAQFNLGLIYYNGNLIQRDINKAIYYFTLAANQNNTDAQNTLGYIHYKGEFVARDINRAIHYFSLAANQNDSRAQFNLGVVIIMTGELIPQNINKIIHYLTRSANQNCPKAQFLLGFIYYLGKFIQRNVYKGIDLIMQSSKNDLIEAHFPLAFFYHEGKYLEQDIKKSVSLYKEGSSFNDQYSKNNLGILYKNGFGEIIEKKLPYSIIYFEEAIKQKNDILSKYNLAHVYIYEESTNESIHKSIKYLVESFESGFDPSKELLCVALIKIHGININEMTEEILKYTNNPDKIMNSIQEMIDENKLYLTSNFDRFYENQKYIDFLYNEMQKPIISRHLQKNEEKPKPKIIGFEITEKFYEGFGYDIINNSKLKEVRPI